jgi:hypothetical protein
LEDNILLSKLITREKSIIPEPIAITGVYKKQPLVNNFLMNYVTYDHTVIIAEMLLF